jgi:hypothetical protein
MDLKNKISSENKFSYTDLTYQQIVNKVAEKFSNDEKFKHFNESDLAPMVLELFAGMTDMINYNIERAAEESYFSTAKRYRSVAKLAGDLGYDIQRPIPAKATIKFVFNGTAALKSASSSSSEFVRNKTIFIPKNTDFIYDGLRFVLADDIYYELSDAELNKIKNPGSEAPFTIDVILNQNKTKVIPTIIQGSIRVFEFKGKENSVNFQTNNLGKTFQTYYVDDTTFSNLYGDKDIYDGTTTIVGVGSSYAEAMSWENRYTIKRKSLVDARDISSQNLNTSLYNQVQTEGEFYSEQAKLLKNVWIRTSAEVEDGKGVELRFGDGIVTSIGADTKDKSVFVQYLSTQGSFANRSGVLDKELRILDSNGNLKELNVFMKVRAYFTSNINGGGDIEPLQSIKNTAPGIFQTFDRLVTKKDYHEFLKSLTTPIDVKNAIAWGENDEIDNSQYHNEIPEDVSHFAAIRKLFNVVLYTCIGSLYYNDAGIIKPKKDLYSAILDAYNGNYIYPSQNYITIMAQKEIVKQLKFNNMLIDGTIPIENFKFNMEFGEQQGYLYSTFPIFFGQLAYPRYWVPNKINPYSSVISDSNPEDPTDMYDAKARFCGIPTALKWTLDNPNIDKVFPLKSVEESRHAVWYPGESLGIEINLPDYKSTVNKNIDLDLKRVPYTFEVYEQSLNQLGYPLYNIELDSNKQEVMKKVVLPPQGTLYVGATGGDTSSGLAIIKDYAYDLWKKLMESTWSDQTKPTGFIEVGDNNSETTVKQYFGYTPWGYVTNELEDKFNYGIKESLTGKDFYELEDADLSEYEKSVKNFKFVTLTINIEEDEEEVTDFYSTSYITDMMTIQGTNRLGDDLNNISGINSVTASITGNANATSFSLVELGTFDTNQPSIIKTYGKLLEVLSTITFNNDNGNIRWFTKNGDIATVVPVSTDPVTIANFDLFTDFSTTKSLKTYFTRTVGDTTQYMTLASVDYVLKQIYKIRTKIDEYLINAVAYRSGYNYTAATSRGQAIRVKGNYANLIQTYVDGINTGIETNYSTFKPECLPNWNYFKSNKGKFQGTKWADRLDWLRNTYGQNVVNKGKWYPYVPADYDPRNIIGSYTEETLIKNYYDWVALRIFKTDLGIPFDGNGVSTGTGALLNTAQDDDLAGVYANKAKTITDILGVNALNFYGYYPSNDVNVQDSLYSDKITIVNDYLNERNQLTVKSIYLSPIIHEFQLWGTIYVKDLNQIDKLRTDIENNVYTWLDIENDFGKDIYLSNLIEIIESSPEVTNTNVKLLPYNSVPKPYGQKYYFDIDKFDSDDYSHIVYGVMPDKITKQKFRTIVMNALYKYMTDHELNMVQTNTIVGPIPYDNKITQFAKYTLYNKQITTYDPAYTGDKKLDTNDHFLDWQKSALASDVNEKTFLNELCKVIINQCEDEKLMDINGTYLTRNKLFFMLLAEIHNDFKPIIGYNMLNSYGDITKEYDQDVLYKDGSLVKPVLRGGYSLNNEIVQVKINATFKYREL